jgi:hypothetical protein
MRPCVTQESTFVQDYNVCTAERENGGGDDGDAMLEVVEVDQIEETESGEVVAVDRNRRKNE